MSKLIFDSHLAIAQLDNETLDKLKSGLTFRLSKEILDKILDSKFKFPFHQINPLYPEVIRVGLDTSSGYVFPTGLIRHVLGILPKDKEKRTSNYKPSDKPVKLNLRDYQREALGYCLNNYRGIVKIPTGGGKTFIEGELCNQLHKARIIITVPTISLLYEIQSKISNMTGEEIGLIGDGNWDKSHRITVAIPKSLISRSSSLKSWLGSLDVWIADEVHKLSNRTGWEISALLHFCRYRIGFSATPCINPILYGMFGPIIYLLKEESSFDKGLIERPIIKIYESPTSPHYHPRASRKCRNMRQYNSLYKTVILDNVGRNKLIAKLALDYLRDKNKNALLIIVNRIHKKPNHPERLLPLLVPHIGEIPIIKGSGNEDNRVILDDLAKGVKRIAIAGPNIIREGIDIPNIGGIIIAGAGKGGAKDNTSGYRHGFIQQVGRSLRKGSHTPEIFILRDSQFVFKTQSEELIESAELAYGAESLVFY